MPASRLGVALVVPPPWAAEVDGLRRACGDGALGRIPPHLTLVPPVNVRVDRLAEATARLRSAAAATRPLTVTLGPPTTFLPVNPVVYLAVGGAGIDALHALRDLVFVEPLARRLSWAFVPHVTLADGADPARIPAAVAALADYVIDVTFDRVTLLEEGPGRRWSAVAEALFVPAALTGRGGVEVEVTASGALDRDIRAWADAHEGDPPTPFALVARVGGQVTGVAEGATRGDRAALFRLMVAPAERGQGIGSRLLAAAAALAADRGCTTMAATARGDAGAVAFLQRHGWSPDDVTQGDARPMNVTLHRDL